MSGESEKETGLNHTESGDEAGVNTGVSTTLIVVAGFLSLVLSGVFLYLSTNDLLNDVAGSQNRVFVKLTVSRLFGISAFMIGVVAIFNQKWTAGSLLLIGSIALPFVALLVHGTI